MENLRTKGVNAERDEFIKEVRAMSAEKQLAVLRFIKVITSGNAEAEAHISNFIANPPDGAIGADYIKALEEAEAIMEGRA